MRSSIAAALIAALTTFVLTWPQRQASAAEQLEKIVQANEGYQGWVHMKVAFEITDEALIKEQMAKGGRPDAPMPVAAEEYNHAADGSRGSVTRFSDGHWTAQLMSVPDQTWTTYDSRGGQLTISVMADATVDSMVRSRKLHSPWSAEGLIDYWRKSKDLGDAKVTVGDDQGMERFDVAFERQAGEAQSFILWADPATGLIQRSQAQMQGARMTSHYTYGEPAIASIYDLGVPREAQVVDLRPAEDVQSVYRAIDQTRGDGIGDFVAFVLDVDVKHDEPIEKQLVSVKLLARKGQAWLSNRYLLGAREYPRGNRSRRIAVDVPEGWPRPELQPFVDSLFTAIPSEYVVHDGRTGWRALYDSDGSGPNIVITTEDHRGAVTFIMFKEENSIEHYIWPQQEKGDGVSTTIVRDEQRPGLIGLRTTFEPKSYTHNDYKQGPKTVWVDPARNHVLVETFGESSSQGTRFLWHTIRDQFAQLPDGRWYPTSWVESSEHFDASGKSQGKNQTRYNLDLHPGQTLDDKWFTNPQPRLQK